MRIWKVLLGLMAPIATEACVPALAPIAPPPAAIAQATTVDEKAALAVEVGYMGAGALLEAAVVSGRLKGNAAVRANEVDALAYHWVGMARAAYDAGNAESYSLAVRHAEPLIAEVRRLVELAR